MDAAITALAPWFGSDRMQAPEIAPHLNGAAWLGIPFCGGLSVVGQVRARTIVANDRHRHIVNLARVDAAADYFVSQWMGRSGKAGTKGEFVGGLSVRWTSSGGSSIRRYRSAVESLDEWHAVLRRCEFTCLDFSEFLEACRKRDHAGHVIYADPPWPGLGEEYRHVLTPEQHADLATRLADFQHTKVVVRLNDHPLVRDLYPADRWRWITSPSRNQANREVAEVLLIHEGT